MVTHLSSMYSNQLFNQFLCWMLAHSWFADPSIYRLGTAASAPVDASLATSFENVDNTSDGGLQDIHANIMPPPSWGPTEGAMVATQIA